MIAKRIILVVILIAFAWILTVVKDHVPSEVRDFGTQKNTEVDSETGISFKFPRGYVLEEIYPGLQDTELIKTYVLVPESNYDIFQDIENTKKQPAITIHIFKNEQNIGPREWLLHAEVEEYTSPQIGDISATLAGGVLPAISFSTEGLFPNDNVMVSHDGMLVFISVSYDEPSSKIRQAFRDIVSSFSFGERKFQEL